MSNTPNTKFYPPSFNGRIVATNNPGLTPGSRLVAKHNFVYGQLRHNLKALDGVGYITEYVDVVPSIEHNGSVYTDPLTGEVVVIPMVDDLDANNSLFESARNGKPGTGKYSHCLLGSEIHQVTDSSGRTFNMRAQYERDAEVDEWKPVPGKPTEEVRTGNKVTRSIFTLFGTSSMLPTGFDYTHR